MSELEAFLAARDLLLRHRTDLDAARREFRWPELRHFDWALDYFDGVARGNDELALHLVEESGAEIRCSWANLAHRSSQVASWLAGLGARRGDRLLLMLGNQVALWETLLAAMKLGVVVLPATPLLSGPDLADRLARGQVRWIVTNDAGAERIDALGPDAMRGIHKILAEPSTPPGWLPYLDSYAVFTDFVPADRGTVHEPLLEYFTSGTTARPKLVRHTRQSYPVGHLSTMYWLGLQPGDVHWTISSPGWAKHAWSCFFAPFNAQATVFVYNYARFDGPKILEQIVRHGVTTLCAPPTVWRMLIQQDLRAWPVRLREVISAGEPLNPEVIAQVRAAWGLTIRDGYGQTETTAQIGNPPGQEVVPGTMGRPLPGYEVRLIGPDGQPGDDGEICLDLSARPLGLMEGYADDPERTAEVLADGWYHTGDVGSRGPDGVITYVARTDDVFKSSGYRISPFELESALLEHPAVAEAAVVPSPDPVRGLVPKAFVVLVAGHEPTAETAASIFRFLRGRVSPYKMVRRIAFADLPKTISGKIRRVELRAREAERQPGAEEFTE